jgi:hypothetical protein
MPKPFIIVRQGTNENYTNMMLEKNDVILTVSYVDCDFVYS